LQGLFSVTDELSRTSPRAILLSRIAQAICLAGVALRALFAIPLGFNRAAMGDYIRWLAPNLPELISIETWIAFGVVLSLDLFLSAWVFLEMFGLFGALGRGETMTTGLERRLLRLSLAAFLGTLLTIFASPLYSIAAILTNVPPPHRWWFNLQQDTFFKAAGTIFLFLFVMIVRELRRVDAENKSFV
jgi:hypothetical protein